MSWLLDFGGLDEHKRDTPLGRLLPWPDNAVVPLTVQDVEDVLGDDLNMDEDVAGAGVEHKLFGIYESCILIYINYLGFDEAELLEICNEFNNLGYQRYIDDRLDERQSHYEQFIDNNPGINLFIFILGSCN
jgi:hypothetical protein